MVIPVFFLVATIALVSLIIGMLVRPATIEDEVERELTRIRKEIYRGWSDERIAAHHRDFCTCQVHYLRVHGCEMRYRGASSLD